MANTPIGLYPYSPAIENAHRTTDAAAVNRMQFKQKDTGSTSTELLRGRLGQILTMIPDRGQPEVNIGFRSATVPSPIAQRMIAQLAHIV